MFADRINHQSLYTEVFRGISEKSLAFNKENTLRFQQVMILTRRLVTLTNAWNREKTV